MTLELIITILLFALMILSGGAMLYIAKTSPTDGQTFQVFAGAMHDLLGAFLTLIVPRIFGMLKAPNGTAPRNGNTVSPVSEVKLDPSGKMIAVPMKPPSQP